VDYHASFPAIVQLCPMDTDSNLEDQAVAHLCPNMLDTESNLERQAVKSNPENQPTPEVPNRFGQTSVRLHQGRRGRNFIAACGQEMCPDHFSVGARSAEQSSERHNMIQLVTDLYEARSSSFLPCDIRRDRAEVETATGFDRAAGYGEIVLGDFIDMLDHVGAHAGQHFYDLGSGLGQLVFTAGLLGLDATGVEVVTQRHEQACAAMEQAEKQDIGHKHGSIKFTHGSFYDVDFSDADIVFINSILFSDEMMLVISQKARKMKHGSRILSYLSLPDVDQDQKDIGTWFRQMKSISLRTTFSSGSPWKSYIAMGTSHSNNKPWLD